MKAVAIAVFAGVVGCAFVQPSSAVESAKFKEKVVWSFGSGMDGQTPVASLIDVKGTLYGTTIFGGAYSQGSAFSLDPSTGAEKVIYSFCSQDNCADGLYPEASLIDVKGTLYGTTESGGTSTGCRNTNGCGAVFALDPNTGAERVLYSFCPQQNCTDGLNPEAGLIYMTRRLYGTTVAGGASDNGTAFALDPKTGAQTVLYSFCSRQNCKDGANPASALIDVNGALYGATEFGGTGGGTVFALDPNTGAETVLHSFGGGTDGAVPEASPIAANGLLYGTTSGGGVTGCGPYGCGTVFSIDPSTGAETILHSFCSKPNCTDGANPTASLIAVNSLLYGTTFGGGSIGCGGEGCGTVFSIDPNTGAEKVLYAFCAQQNCEDGQDPNTGLIAVNDKLYGTTFYGGAYGQGTVFALKKKR